MAKAMHRAGESTGVLSALEVISQGQVLKVGVLLNMIPKSCIYIYYNREYIV
jgi:hypothetical protein